MNISVFYRAACAAFVSVGLAGAAQAASTPWWSPYTTDANTLGLWHFDDVTGSTGTFADSSANALNGTLNGNAGVDQTGVGGLTLTVPAVSGAGTGPGAGLFGTALDYDENQNAAVLASGNDSNKPFAWGMVTNTGGALNGSTALTVEAWIKPTAGDLARSETYILGTMNGSGGYNFGLLGGTLFMDTLSSSLGYHYVQQSGVTLVADTWAHVAAVLTNNGVNTTETLYINGASVGTGTWAAASLVPSGSVLEIGNSGANPKYVMFRSQIDEVRISNVAREFGAAPIPEPASLSLLGLGGLYFLRRRRA